MTSKEFRLPDVGEGIAEATIVRWLVSPGESVAEDQPIAEVETDKAIVEIPSPYTGVVDELRAAEGETVSVGTTIITVGIDGETPSSDPDTAMKTTDVASSATSANEVVARSDSASGREATDGHKEPRNVLAPPSVRRFAREQGIELEAVAAARSTNRPTKTDVRAAAERASGTAAIDDIVETDSGSDTVKSQEHTDADVTDSTAQTDRTLTLARPNTRRIAREHGVEIDEIPTEERRDGNAYVTETQVRQYAQPSGRAATAETISNVSNGDTAAPVGDGQHSTATAETKPYQGIRKTIGERMATSKFTAPHVTHHDTATASGLVETRETLSAAAGDSDTSVTYLPFVLKAVVAALKRHPILNSTLDEEAEEIKLRSAYHVGIAVATEYGLVVPVIRDVDTKGIATLAAEVGELAERARSRRLEPDEMSGSTFTVTNFGAIGGEYGTPILNYPETAILGLGAIDERPVAEGGEVVARPTLPLSLSFDHRVIDGAAAAAFTNTVMRYVEQPQLLLMED